MVSGLLGVYIIKIKPVRNIVYLFFVLCLVVACGNPNKETTTPSDNFYSRDKFEELFYGKPESFVEKRLGKPDKVQELNGIHKTWWWYKGKTHSNNVMNPDAWALLGFDESDFHSEGKVIEISYK